ncbi:acetylornithine deacetylase [Microbaculum marinum]|uniref:Acetylornithine deacetylase n=1 Tax=Microbaculum marinum TaxID=1764581 RepID=A0AAW9RJY6_9HYPH
MTGPAGPDRDACIAVIRDLIAFPTVSDRPNRDLLDYVARFLADHGVDSEILWNEDRSKGNLWATIGPDDRPGVVLSGHSDVVPIADQAWTADPFALRIDNDRIYGRGACDMKGFVGIALAFVPTLVTLDLKVPVHIAISYDEELGCTGVRSLIDRLAGFEVRPALCIVGEPTSMQVVVGHKGGGFYRVTVHGRSAHSSLAPKAVNAVEYAADIAAIIRDLAREQATTGPREDGYEIPHSTISVNALHGGTAYNVVPETCELKFDIRSLPELDMATVISRLRARIDAEVLPRMRAIEPTSSVEIEPVVELLGLSTDAGDPAVTFIKRLVGRNDHLKVAYGTEAGLFSREAGIPTVVCGPGSIDQAHKPDEFLDLSEIDACRAFLARLSGELAEAGLPW